MVMAEYIIYWSGIGAELIELSKTTPPWLWPKRIREKRLKERIVRCKDCKKRLPKGYRFDEFCNEAKQDACSLFSNHDFDWDYTSYWYVKPDDFCAWGERREK